MVSAFLDAPSNADQTNIDDDSVVVVCDPGMRKTLLPWETYRTAEGWKIEYVSPQLTAEKTAKQIQSSFPNCDAILLVGDVPEFGTPQDGIEIPSFERPTTVTAKFGSTPTYSTDAPYADFDHDGIPNVAVGRLPVRTESELKVVLQKILESDQSTDFGPWRSKIELVGGVGGFGMLIDNTIEMVTRNVLTQSLPKWTRTSILFGSPGHRFYTDKTDPSFRDAVYRRYEKGCRFWVYAGHGHVTTLDRVPQTFRGRPVLDNQSLPGLERQTGQPSIALVLACFTGAHDSKPRCFAETMLMQPMGPSAVIAASRVSMPYGNAKLSIALINSIYESKQHRLGQAWKNAQAKLRTHAEPQANEKDKAPAADTLDLLATMMTPQGAQLKEEKLEHADLYQLFGDPTMRLHPHQAASLDVVSTQGDRGIYPGDALQLTLQSPLNGEATVTFDLPIGTVVKGDPNETTRLEKTLELTAEKTETIDGLKTDSLLPGWYDVRLHVAGTDGWAVASDRIHVRRKSDTGD